jgi:DivIVA domain-containing protein
MWFWVVVIVLMIGAVTVLLVGSGTSMSDAYDDRPDQAIPVGRPLTADDLEEVRFTTAMRGYRMDEVDALLDRFRADLLTRESARPRSGGSVPTDQVGEDSTFAGGEVPDAPESGSEADEAKGTTTPMPTVPPSSDADVDAGGHGDSGARRDE